MRIPETGRRHAPPTFLLAVLLWFGGMSHNSFSGSADADGFLAVVTAHFSRWDKDRNGVLSTDELNVLVADPGIAGQEAAAVAALKRVSRSSKYKLPPLTVANISQLVSAPETTNRTDLPRKYQEGYQRLTNVVSREMFASGLPRLETIHQGKLGNCFCLAPLGAMVYRDPRQVAAMFVRQEDGRFRVTLGKHAVCIAPPTDTELAMTSSNERDGIWVNMYEKSLGEARNEAKPAKDRAGSPIDTLARGGSASDTLAFITGHEIKRFLFKDAKDPAVLSAQREAKLEELRHLIDTAVSQRRLMTCATLKATTPGIASNHAYAVLGYHKADDAVTLWNPQGGSFTPKGPIGLVHGYPQKDGIFSVPLLDLVQQFKGITFEVSP